MKKKSIILLLISLTYLSSYSFAQKQDNNKKHDPEKIFQFLDRNNDKKLSKKEASKAKKLYNNFNHLDTNKDGYLNLEELKGSASSSKYTYLENDGIFMYYETKEKEYYRKLLPNEFDMPDHLLVYTFICDFYKMDDQTQPYKETSIFLLGKYKGKEVWHCIYMPVTSKESMIVGKNRLGLPKTMGEIDFLRSDPEYKGTTTDENDCKISLKIDTKNHSLSEEEKKLLNDLTIIPKMNILNGEVIEMTGGRNGSIFNLSENFPNKLTIKSGKGTIDFDTSALKNKTDISPLDLKPSKILVAYYLSNKIPFRLGKK